MAPRRADGDMLGGLDRRILERRPAAGCAPAAAAPTPGSADRRGSGSASASHSAALSSATRLMPWWWAMNVGSDDAAGGIVRRAARACSRSPRSSRSGRPALRPQALEIADHFRRRQRRGEHRGVRRDDQIVGEAPLQAEAGHAEGAVLIVALEVLQRCRPTRRCPTARRAARRSASGARPRPRRFRRAASGVAAHHQQRHQVLEHRRAPREQRA